MKDHLTKATAEGLRIYAAVTTELVSEAMKRHDCWPVAAAALGRTMTGALLFAANLKNKEAITIQFCGNGPLGKVTADAVPEGYVRGYVDMPHVDLPLNEAGKLDVGGAVGNEGIVRVTRFLGLKDPVAGSAELVNGEIAEDLTNYLYQSEQTPSSVGLGVLIHPDGRVAAGGFLLQPLPDASDEVISHLEENLKHVRSVSHMVDEGLDAKGIIAEILAGFSVNYLSDTNLAFRCHCSRHRIEGVLAGLRDEDLASLISDGHAEVHCHFCGETYEFSQEELERLRTSRKVNRNLDGENPS